MPGRFRRRSPPFHRVGGLLAIAVGLTGVLATCGHAIGPTADGSAPDVLFADAELPTDAGQRCGDGVRQPPEECDGADRGGVGCVALGYAGGVLTCTAACRLDPSGCVPLAPLCGNGVREAPEACDGTDLGGATCASLGYAGGELFCTVGCEHETAWCVPPACGDGVVDPGEACDDGDLFAGDGCDACTVTPGWVCHGQPSQCCRGFWQGPDCTGPCVVFVDGRPGPVWRDGTSWATAFAHPQEAVDAAFAEGAGCEVWVAEGTYRSWQTGPADRLSLRAGTQLYGGFAGNEAYREARDPEAHPTVLDGRSPADPDARVFHVVDASGIGWARIDGFVVTSGDASQIDATPIEERCGGGIRIRDADVEIQGCRFENNRAEQGGAVAVLGTVTYDYSNLWVNDCRFLGNVAVRGGGLWIGRRNQRAEVSRSEFTANSAFRGGAAYLEGDGPVEITNSRLSRNRAERGGAIWLWEARDGVVFQALLCAENEAERGGAIFFAGTGPVTFRVAESVFVTNRASRSGAFECSSCWEMDWNAVVFADNVATASYGGVGALRFFGGPNSGAMTDLVFSGNRSASGPGAIGASGGSFSVSVDVFRTIFVGNSNETTTWIGGAPHGAAVAVPLSLMWFDSCVYAGNHGRFGGAHEQFFPNGFQERITQSTFVGNVSEMGPGAVLAAFDGTNIANSIVWDNQGSGGAQIAPSLPPFQTGAVHRCLVQGGNPGTDILDEDPQFVGYPTPVVTGTWTEVSYDPDTFQTTLRDGAAAWAPGAWAGYLVRPSHQDVRWLHVAESTGDSLVLWGDFTGWIQVGDTYKVHDLRLAPTSPAIDYGDDTYASPLDLDGYTRVDYPAVGVGPDISDLGAYECQP